MSRDQRNKVIQESSSSDESMQEDDYGSEEGELEMEESAEAEEFDNDDESMEAEREESSEELAAEVHPDLAKLRTKEDTQVDSILNKLKTEE